MFLGGFVLLGAMFAFLLVPLALLVFALVDLVQRSDAEWAASGQDRLTWVLISLFVGLLGPLLYLVIARPKLEDAKFRLQQTSPVPGLAPPPPPVG